MDRFGSSAMRSARLRAENSRRPWRAWYEDHVSRRVFTLGPRAAPGPTRLRRGCCLLLCGWLSTGAFACGGAPEQPHIEVKARKQTPVAVCTTQLAPVKASSGGKAVVRNLDPEQWMNVLIPAF